MKRPWRRGRRGEPCTALCLILLGLLLIVVSGPQWLLCTLAGSGLCCAGTVMLIRC